MKEKEKNELLELMTNDIKQHEWYKDYSVEACREMAKYQLERALEKKEQREIRSSAFVRANNRMNRDIESFLK